jgi:L-lactate dehydrogenase complex protein LldG
VSAIPTLAPLLAAFADRAATVGTETHFSARGEAPCLIARLLAKSAARHVALDAPTAAAVPLLAPTLREAGLSVVPSDAGTSALAAVDAGASLAAFGVAETGSVALDEPNDDRAACFLAERLWVLVPEHEIMPTLDQALERMRDLVRGGSHHPLLMSGPSRTADIERTLTVGVHGPRAMVVVVVVDAANA